MASTPDFLTVLEARGPTSRCGWAWFLLRPLSLAYRSLPCDCSSHTRHPSVHGWPWCLSGQTSPNKGHLSSEMRAHPTALTVTESLRKRSCLQIQSHPEVQDMNLGRHNCARNSNPNVSGSQSGRDLASASCFQLRLSPREAWHRLLAHIRRKPELTHYHLPNWTQVCNFCSFQFQSMTVKENWICNGIVFFPVGTQQSNWRKDGREASSNGRNLYQCGHPLKALFKKRT